MFQLKRPSCPPAIKLSRVISRAGMEAILSEIASHGGGEWRVSRVGRTGAGHWYANVLYRPARGGEWMLSFGITDNGDAILWAD